MSSQKKPAKPVPQVKDSAQKTGPQGKEMPQKPLETQLVSSQGKSAATPKPQQAVPTKSSENSGKTLPSPQLPEKKHQESRNFESESIKKAENSEKSSPRSNSTSHNLPSSSPGRAFRISKEPDRRVKSVASTDPRSKPHDSLNRSFLLTELNTVEETQAVLTYKKSPQKNPFQSKSGKARQDFSGIEEVDSKIKSRRRVLELLEVQSESINDEAFLQIQSRDSLIEELTKELLETKALIKENKSDHEDNMKLKQLQQRVNDLERERNHFQSLNAELIEEKQAQSLNFKEEKAQYEGFIEALNEEIELLKTQMGNKDDEIANMLADIRRLSEIIQQFKNLNSELNKKIDKQNEEVESFKIKYFEAEVKSSSVNELETSLNNYIRLYKKSEARLFKSSEELRSSQLLYDDLQAFCQYCEEKIAEVISKIDEDFFEFKPLVELKQELGNRKKVEVEKVKHKDNEVKIRNLHEQLEKANRDYRILENAQKPLTDEIIGLKELIQNIKNDHVNSVERLNSTIKTLQDYSESLKTEIQSVRIEIGKKEIKITSATSKLIVLEAKEAKHEEKIQKILESRALIEKDLIDYKEKFNAIKAQLKDKTLEIAALQKDLAKKSITVQALHEEFWKKDNSILKLKKTISILQKTIEDQSNNRLNLPKNSETNEKILKELYEKTQKIEVLKDMIKSLQNKSKEGAKAKVKDLDPDLSMELHPEKFEKSEQELLNSLVAKTINKFFRICSFNRNAADTPPDVARLVKRLRQDLRMYNVFSTRDLQLTVPMLQQPLVDIKPHLNLDELITIISKVAYAM